MEEIVNLNRVGMRLAGAMAVFGPIFIILASLLLLGVPNQMIPVEGSVWNHMIFLWDNFVIVLLGIVSIGISRSRFGLRWGREIIAAAVIVMLFSGITAGLSSGIQVDPKDYVLTFTMLMLISIGTMPYRPQQTFLLGLLMIGTYYFTLTYFPQANEALKLPIDPGYLIAMVMISIFCTLISGLIYSNRFREVQARKSEEILREKALASERKYRSLFEDSSDGIFAFNNKTKVFTLVNSKLTDILGHTQDKLLAMKFTDLIHPDDFEMVLGYHTARIQGEHAPTHYKVKLIRKDSDKPVICDLTVHRTGEGDITMGALRDVTEHVEMEARIEQLAQFPETNPFPVLRCDYHGKVLYLNPTARELLEKLGKPDQTIIDLLPGDFVSKIQGLIDQDKTITYERIDLSDRSYSVTYRPLPESKQIFVWMVDITDLVYAQHRIRIYVAELEATNHELRETQSQLVQSEKMAALGNLVAGVAHEINSPLGSISANADVSSRALKILNSHFKECALTEEPAENAKLEQALNIITESNKTSLIATDRIVGIVRTLRNFARLDEAELDRVNIHDGLESTLTLLHHELKQKITVEKNFGDLPVIECYPNQLNQVFMNIIMNAAQAIKGEGTIRISTRRESDWAVIEFLDTGQGIPEEPLRHVFDPGFTTKGVGVGTGLGLSISYRIIQEHKGSITVASEVGQETTFTIKLPVT